MNNMRLSDTIMIDEKVAAFGKIAETKYKKPTNSDFKLPSRTWPDKDIEKAPIWCSVDLRDGNQSLEETMSVKQKLEYFNILVQRGFKEIEVGFPSASSPDYKFIRKLIDENLIPDGVKIQVLSGCREDLIKKTSECLNGAKDVIIHIYNSTSTIQRDEVFKYSKEEVIKLAEIGVDLVKKYFKEFSGSLQLEYSPESFTGTEVEFANEICKRVIKKWNGFGGNNIIINLPATVENSTPDRYADKIEYMSRELTAFTKEIKSKIKALISVHTHNDRGTAIAATELAIKAGADRVEGVLGTPNGERVGNVDIGTVALNMFTQGISPRLDLSNIGETSSRISEIIKIPIHPRYPYTGELVHTAYSGGHQDAISKTLKAQEEREKDGNEFWDVAYLPINPKHIGLEYEPIKVNSQSGKGGATFLLEKLGYKVPKNMQVSIGREIQKITDNITGTLSKKKIGEIFNEKFVNVAGPIKLDEFDFDEIRKMGRRNQHGPIEELKIQIEKKYNIKIDKLADYEQKSLTAGADAKAISYFEIIFNGKKYYGCGLNKDFEVSALKGLISTINIALRD